MILSLWKGIKLWFLKIQISQRKHNSGEKHQKDILLSQIGIVWPHWDIKLNDATSSSVPYESVDSKARRECGLQCIDAHWEETLRETTSCNRRWFKWPFYGAHCFDLSARRDIQTFRTHSGLCGPTGLTRDKFFFHRLGFHSPLSHSEVQDKPWGSTAEHCTV